MRYQPAYIYTGTRRIEREIPQQPRQWKFQVPRLRSANQTFSVKMLRLLLLVAGMLLFVVGAAHFYTAQMAQGWERVSVTITQSEVVRMKYDEATPVFTAKLQYDYVVAGKTYTGTRLAVRPIRSSSPGEVKRQIAPFTPGRTVIAMVNPNKPDQVFLNTNPPLYIYYLVLPGLILAAISMAIGQAVYIRAERQERKAWRFGEFKGPMPATA